MGSISLSWKPQGAFHHVGFVVASIAECAQAFAILLSAEWDGEIIQDANQDARVSFLRGNHASDPLFELVEPCGEKSHLLSFVNRGGGLHHICYEVEALEPQLEQSRSRGGLIVRAPVPAVAFGGRRIAWVYTKQQLLLEYLER